MKFKFQCVLLEHSLTIYLVSMMVSHANSRAAVVSTKHKILTIWPFTESLTDCSDGEKLDASVSSEPPRLLFYKLDSDGSDLPSQTP